MGSDWAGCGAGIGGLLVGSGLVVGLNWLWGQWGQWGQCWLYAQTHGSVGYTINIHYTHIYVCIESHADVWHVMCLLCKKNSP